ncbi:hypothetical protein ACFJIX_21625 [Roseateles sp. UC29_93]|uniref:hypothetical protein n=1 Tax=Roseateles sp. UC29_93 TaxID=3350177 RepID=UPI00366CBC14
MSSTATLVSTVLLLGMLAVVPTQLRYHDFGCRQINGARCCVLADSLKWTCSESA